MPNELKAIIAKNIAALRTGAGMTQIDLAEKLNYSDKAVSKWERGESIPDVLVLKQIADMFQVTVDYLLEEEHAPAVTSSLKDKIRRHNRGFITAISILLVWLLATFIFMIVDTLGIENSIWFIFIYAVPSTFVVWLVFNSIWFDRRRNFMIVSLLMWSVLASAYLTLLPFELNVWLLFVVGVPGQLIIVLWSRLKKNRT
ncbi:MAG: helix-turn-helix transcriptional regulator [Clostridia bacterium]|nr:helix-turn-helix transcriptional regulator [Clostridia bacterium]MBR5903266.1 helix-turn-helix transcriptional regulator [Clostridia bacterium]